MSEAAYDVVVVGGGLIGAAAALAVARCGRRVLLLERRAPSLNRGVFGMDVRNVTVSPASAALLEELGVWADLDPAPIREMHVWEDRGTQVLRFTAAEVERTELGWIVENSPIVLALWAAAQGDSRVDVELGRELEGLVEGPDGIELQTGSGSFFSRLVIGVDGARSTVRKLVGVATTDYPTGHHALATLVRAERPHQGIAHQRFLLDGPLALLPSHDAHVVSVVWSQNEAAALRRRDLAETEFCREIGEAVEGQLGDFQAVAERMVFPLNQQLVSSFNPSARVLLMGDAARVVHPLAGLGANVGFEDVRDLGLRFAELTPAADPGARGVWAGFARQRRTRSRMVLGAMSTLRRIYATDDPLLGLLRNTGVKLTGQLKPFKRQLILEALGLGPLAQRW